jgi:hypothetical protein
MHKQKISFESNADKKGQGMMKKVEAQQSRIHNQPAVRRGQGAAVESPHSERIAQLEAMMKGSPRMDRLSRCMEGVDQSPAMTLQRKKLQTLFDGTAQRKTPAQSNDTGLPDNLKSGIEALSSISMDSVKVHYNSPKPAQLNALAYAQGEDIHLAPGQERHLPHEAWHVVQQAQGRVKPTMQMQEGVQVNDDQELEREADWMGAKAAQMQEKQTAVVGAPAPAPGSAVAQTMRAGDVVQMNGYTLSGAGDAMAIAEQEVGTGKTIRFTTFTSCIGVIGKKGDGTLVGIHLVRFGSHGEPFKEADIPTVKARLSGLTDITIIGQTDFWEQELLDEIGGTVIGGTDDGSFRATTDGSGKIIVEKNA